MSCISIRSCSRIFRYLLQLLSTQEPRWDLPALAFLVEVLKFLDLTKSGVSILKIMSRHLQSECRERRRLALRGLVVLSKDPLTARRMCSVSQSLLELLGDADGDVVSMSLRVFRNVLQHKDILVSSTTAPKLAEALLLLFDHDNSYVQVLSLELFFRVMDLVVDEGKKPLEKILSQSLLPLFFYCHDENQRIAKASQETLLRVAEFLKRRKLKQLVKKEQLWKFAERLLEEDRSRVAEHLRQTLPYLDSPQEPLREAAVRFMGMAGVLLMGQQEELHALSQGAALDQTQEQEPSRGRFRKSLKVPAAIPTWAGPAVTAQPSTTLGALHGTHQASLSFVLLQMFRKFLRIRRRKTGSTAAEGPAKPDSGLTELQAEPDVSPDSAERSEDSDASATETWAKALHSSKTEDVAITNSNNEETQGITNTDTTPAPTMIHAPTMDFFEESAVLSQQQVPGIVRNIHQSLVSHVSVDARLQIDLVRLAEEHPADVVLTLLRCAPTCDRAAAMMWRTIGSSGPAVEKVLPTLLRVMEDWPLHRMCTSDGDNEDVFALAATLVIWVIVQVPACNKAMIPYSSHLFVALLFHVVITTQQTPPEEVDNFWRACQEEHRLPSKPNRFAVQVMKALLYQLRCDRVVKAMKHKRGWDMLLCADTQHYAVGLLAR
ncbi:uncharacterized protein [Anomalospiza imberbis]|uniref:uncharacterized protein n=1 Tax=Anomalospiza imberbis TaxID=187417 RepID=UPI00359028CD